MQVEYHYYPDNEISRPPAMLAVLQGLKRRGLRTFSVEPNIWWLNNGHDFMEFAYVQVRPTLQAGTTAGYTLCWVLVVVLRVICRVHVLHTLLASTALTVSGILIRQTLYLQYRCPCIPVASCTSVVQAKYTGCPWPTPFFSHLSEKSLSSVQREVAVMPQGRHWIVPFKSAQRV